MGEKREGKKVVDRGLFSGLQIGALPGGTYEIVGAIRKVAIVSSIGGTATCGKTPSGGIVGRNLEDRAAGGQQDTDCRRPGVDTAGNGEYRPGSRRVPRRRFVIFIWPRTQEPFIVDFWCRHNRLFTVSTPRTSPQAVEKGSRFARGLWPSANVSGKSVHGLGIVVLQADSERIKHHFCGFGGNGGRAVFSTEWPKRAGSSPSG